MTTPRRIGTAASPTRTILLDVTEELILAEGYAAVSSRSVATRAGVKAPLVHYYFPTLDDLFVAVFDRRTEANLARLAEALAGPRPLHVLWNLTADPRGGALWTEFIALANHRKTLSSHLRSATERLRTMQIEVIEATLARSPVDVRGLPPAALAFLVTAIPRGLVLERALDVDSGHSELRTFVEPYLDLLEPPEVAPAG